MFNDTAPEITAAFQPKAACNGTISTPGAARTPTEARITTNITATPPTRNARAPRTGGRSPRSHAETPEGLRPNDGRHML